MSELNSCGIFFYSLGITTPVEYFEITHNFFKNIFFKNKNYFYHYIIIFKCNYLTLAVMRDTLNTKVAIYSRQ